MEEHLVHPVYSDMFKNTCSTGVKELTEAYQRILEEKKKPDEWHMSLTRSGRERYIHDWRDDSQIG